MVLQAQLSFSKNYQKLSLLLSSEVEEIKKTKVYCATNTAFFPGSRNNQFILNSQLSEISLLYVKSFLTKHGLILASFFRFSMNLNVILVKKKRKKELGQNPVILT